MSVPYRLCIRAKGVRDTSTAASIRIWVTADPQPCRQCLSYTLDDRINGELPTLAACKHFRAFPLWPLRYAQSVVFSQSSVGCCSQKLATSGLQIVVGTGEFLIEGEFYSESKATAAPHGIKVFLVYEEIGGRNTICRKCRASELGPNELASISGSEDALRKFLYCRDIITLFNSTCRLKISLSPIVAGTSEIVPEN